MNTFSTIVSIISWAASVLYILAYLLLSIGWLSAKSFLYHTLNFLGAAGLIFNGFYLKDTPNIAVNSIWFFIALFAIFKRFIHTKRNPVSEEVVK